MIKAIGLLLLFGSFSVFFVLACASELEPTATVTPKQAQPIPTVDEILSKAANRFEALHYFSFLMTHEGGGTAIALGLEMDEVVGRIAAPDRLQAEIKARAAGLFFDVAAIAVEDETYLTNPFTGEYEKIGTGIRSGGFFDPVRGIGTIMRNAIDPVLQGEVELKETEAYLLTGSIRSEDLDAISPEAASGFLVQARIWIGRDDFLVRKLLLEGKITERDNEEVARTIVLSDFDVPVTIEAPVIEGDS